MTLSTKHRWTGIIALSVFAAATLPWVFDSTGYKELYDRETTIPDKPQIVFEQHFDSSRGKLGSIHPNETLELIENVAENHRKDEGKLDRSPSKLPSSAQWIVQTNVFSTTKNAVLEKSALAKLGYGAAKMEEFRSSTKTLIRVFLGPFSKSRAQEVKAALRKVSKKSPIVKALPRMWQEKG